MLVAVAQLDGLMLTGGRTGRHRGAATSAPGKLDLRLHGRVATGVEHFKWTCKDCFTKELAKASPANASALERLRTRWWREAKGDEDLGKPRLESLLGGFEGLEGLEALQSLPGMDLEALQGMQGFEAFQEIDAQSKELLEQLIPGLMGE